jgi:RNA polymerase sigma factor (sigma-70 family)
MSREERASLSDAHALYSAPAPIPPAHPLIVLSEGPRTIPATQSACVKREREEPSDRFVAEFDLVDLHARQAARRLGAGGATFDELRSYAYEGLLRASRTYDPSYGTAFRYWANRAVRDAIAEGLRQWARLPRHRPRHGTMADSPVSGCDVHAAGAPAAPHDAPPPDRWAPPMVLGLDETNEDLVADPAPDPEQVVSRRELSDRVREAIARLPEPERSLLERHDYGGETLAHVAASLNLSRSWASRLRKRAIERLACEFRG